MSYYGDGKTYSHDEYGEVRVVISDNEPLYNVGDIVKIIFAEDADKLRIENVFGHIVSAKYRKTESPTYQPWIITFCAVESAVRYATTHAKTGLGEKRKDAIEWLEHDVLDAVREEFYSPEAIFMRKYFSEAGDTEKFAVAGILNSLIALSKKRG